MVKIRIAIFGFGIALIWSMFLILHPTHIASADVGEIVTCNSAGTIAPGTIASGDTNDGSANRFTTPSTTVTITGVKLNVYRLGTDNSIPLSIRNSAWTSLATGTLDTSLLPEWDSVTPGNNNFDCDKTVKASQIVELSSPVTLSASTNYWVVLGPDIDGSAWQAQTPITPGAGLGLICVVPTSCTFTSGGTWDPIGDAFCAATCSLGLATYDNILDPVNNDLDSWLTNFLESLGLNSPFGRVLAGSLFSMIIFLILINNGVHWIMSLGLTGLAVTFLTAALIFDPAILLGLVAIVMAAGMGLIYSLFNTGEN